MNPKEQVIEDRKLVKRIDTFGKGLTAREGDLVESCLRRLEQGQALTEAQRKWAQDIDERKVS